MLVSKEKYNEVVLALKKAQEDLQTKEHELSALSAELTVVNNDAKQRAHDPRPEAGGQDAQINDLKKENLQLKDQNEALQTLVSDKEKEVSLLGEQVAKLKADLDSIRQENKNLQTRVDELSELPAAKPAKAIHASDGTVQKSDINTFMQENRHDPTACMQRLKEEGF